MLGQAPDSPPLEALESWARERFGARWPLRAQVLKLIKSYQERPGEPRPFVGRAALMQQLDEWLQEAQAPLLLVSGAAGRGKSALLLHWLGRQVQRDRPLTLIYLPISIRFNTADEAAGVQLLFAALCDVLRGLTAQLPRQPEIQDYIHVIRSAWPALAARSGQQLLARELPANLHVLIAARPAPGDANAVAWLQALAGSPPSRHRVLEIGTFEPEAMAEAVIGLGHPLDRQGDPVLLRRALELGSSEAAAGSQRSIALALAPALTADSGLWPQALALLGRIQAATRRPSPWGSWRSRSRASTHAPCSGGRSR